MSKRSVIGLLVLLSCVLGCGQKPRETNTIVIWHWMTDRQSAFEKLAEKYRQETGIQVSFQLYAPSDIYSQKVVAAAQAKILPDIYGILDKKANFASFIESGFVADLTEEFARDNGAWEKTFFPKALNANRFSEGNVYKVKPGIYGVPIDVTNIQVLYNKKLLAKAGIVKVPSTLEEFLAAGEALKRTGISGFVTGWGELWLVDCFASNYAFNIMGEEKVMATFRGEVPYTDPDWVKVLTVFKRLKDSGILSDGIVTKVNKYAEQDFALERAAFAFNGSWCVNVYKDMNPDLDYGVTMPPAAGTAFPMRIWGGAGSSFVVNNGAPNQAKAIAFLKWLTAREQQVFLAEETKNLPANREAIASVPQVLSEFAGAMDEMTHPTIWEHNEDRMVSDTFDRGVQSILIGEKTPEEVAAMVQAFKTKQIEKARKRESRK